MKLRLLLLLLTAPLACVHAGDPCEDPSAAICQTVTDDAMDVPGPTPPVRLQGHHEGVPTAPVAPQLAMAEKADEDRDEDPIVLPEVTLQCELTWEGGLPPDVEGPFLHKGSTIYGNRAPCHAREHAAAGARGSVQGVTLSEWKGDSPARLTIRNLHGGILSEAVMDSPGNILHVGLPQSGEFLIRVEPTDPAAPANEYGLTLDCLEGCDLEYTRHPIVLLHGIGGTDAFGDGEYFHGVQALLEPLGYAVHVPTVSAFSTPPKRAKEWEVALDDLVAQGIGRRFNLIAHSQGGLDARHLISTLGRDDLVSSLVTISTPHHGTELADLLVGLIAIEPENALWVNLAAAGFSALFGIEGDDTSLTGALESLTTYAVSEFNVLNPNHEDIYYASWSGMSCGLLEFNCQSNCEGEVVHPALEATYFLMRLGGLENDGMVPRTSGIWADHRGRICADHADQVGLFPHEEGEGFDHVAFYLEEFRRLATLQH